MADLSKGTTFTDGQKNISHTLLNNLVDAATILPAAISGKSPCTDPHKTNDGLLFYDYDATAPTLRKITPEVLVFGNDDLVHDRSEVDAIDALDRVHIADVSAAAGSRNKYVLVSSLVDARLRGRAGAARGVQIDATIGDNTLTIRSGPAGCEVLLADVSDTLLRVGTTDVSDIFLAINGASTGAGGLDVGGLATGWYYVWIISTGTTAAGMLSLQKDLFTIIDAGNMPSGYTYGAVVGMVYYTGAAWRSSYQRGDLLMIGKVVIVSAVFADANFQVLSDVWPDGSGCLTTFLTAVPDLASEIFGSLGSTAADAATPYSKISIASDANGLGRLTHTSGAGNAGSFNNFKTGAPFNLPLITRNIAVGGDATTAGRIEISAVRLDI